MSYTYEDLKEDVRKEAEALRVHATPDELQKFDTELFEPNDPGNCIYGQMTGDCASPRAHELIANCCIRMIDNKKFVACDEDSLADCTVDKISQEQLNIFRGEKEN